MKPAARRANPRSVEDVKPKKPADPGRVQSVVRQSLDRAVKHAKQNLEPDQKEATDYYHGRPFGDEEDGRSKVVSTDVRDATLAQMPSLLRIFFGPERAVEYRARGPEDEQAAKQATDYVNFVISEDNEGFLTFHDWFQDALVRRLGIVKYWWDTFYRVEGSSYSGLSADQVMTLTRDLSVDDWELTRVVGGPDGETYDVRVTRHQQEGCARFEAVPNEEFVFTPSAKRVGSSPLVAHVREVPRDTLAQLGISEKLLDDVQGRVDATVTDLKTTRRYDEGQDAEDDDAIDPSQVPVLYAEAYALVDCDGDGVAELRYFQCVGPDYEITNGDGLGEVVDEAPFAVLCPYPEAHTIVGLGNHDLLKDVQRVKSQVQRATLNSLALAVEPKMEVVVGEVNMKDLLSPDINGIVRVQKPGMLREIGHQFVGADTLPVLEHYDQIKEDRTGVSRASAGLDADSLQSSTKAAVAATISGSQQRIEMIARIFAETGVKRLMRGLLRLVVKNQNRERMVRLRNQYVPVDPRAWDAAMDVQVNVGLGQGTPEDRINALGAVLEKQEMLMQAGSPLVSWVEIRNALGRAVEMAGFKNSAEFFRPFGPQEAEQYAQMQAQQPQQPDPSMAMVQLEAQKAQIDAQLEQQKAAHQREIDMLKLQMQQIQAENELALRREVEYRKLALQEAEIEARYSVQVLAHGISADVEHASNQMQAVVEHKKADHAHEAAMMQAENPVSEAE